MKKICKKKEKKTNNNRGPPCEINAATFMLEICFLFLASFEESVESWGICHSSVSVEVATLVPFPNAVPLLWLLKLSTGQCTRTAQALLQHMGICRLYPLVVILLCLNNLKAKLLVKVNGRLIADLHMTVGWENTNALTGSSSGKSVKNNYCMQISFHANSANTHR